MSGHADWAHQAMRALRTSGHRAGGARQAVIEVLAEAGGGVTALEIAEQLRTGPRRAGMASVYRALAVLGGLGLVRRVDIGSGISRYELVLPSGEHDHHLVCARCGRTDLFRDAALEQALRDAESNVRYAVASHDVILHGLCPTCQKAECSPGH
jgi:Fur family ferric uptake transcriptional regulator